MLTTVSAAATGQPGQGSKRFGESLGRRLCAIGAGEPLDLDADALGAGRQQAPIVDARVCAFHRERPCSDRHVRTRRHYAQPRRRDAPD